MTRLALLALLLPGVAHAAGADEEVKMSLPEFLKLYETAKNRPPTPSTAPRQFAISSARYAGEAVLEDGEPVAATFTAKLRVEVLDDKNWVKVPLLPVTVALTSARIAGAEAPVVLENGWYNLVTNKRGAFDVDLAFSSAVTTASGTSTTAFEATDSGATELTFAVPGEGYEITVPNAAKAVHAKAGGKSTVNAAFPSTAALALRWQKTTKESTPAAAAQQEPRIYAQVYTLAGIGDGVLAATATIDHTILFHGVDALKVQIPAGMTVLDVRGNGIEDWKLGADRVLTVDLTYQAEGAYTLAVDLEKVVGDGSQRVDVPLVVPLGVERSKGWIGVEARGNLEIVGGAAKNAAPVDVRVLPAAILGVTKNPVLLGYKYLGTDVSVPLAVTQHENVDVLVTVVDQTRATTMFTADGRRLTSITYEVRNNRRQYLRLNLPEGAELWSASVAGRAAQPGKSSEGQVLIPLVRSSQASGGALAAFDVEVVYVESGEAPSAAGTGEFKSTLPKIDVPSTYVAWTVYAPREAKVASKSRAGTVRPVSGLSLPPGVGRMNEVAAQTEAVRGNANLQIANGALGQGAAPVPVSLPLDGTPWYFEKLLALDEALWVSFDYKGLKTKVK